LAGLLFGAGLLISGMTNPTKVIGFLDVFGSWDPSLACVMAGAIAVHFVLLRLILRRSRPVYAGGFQLLKRSDIDASLVWGAAIFGVGWGIGGLCPGPGVVDAASGSPFALVFMAAMVLGAVVQRSKSASTILHRAH
jgi:uncharacterized membrane protein YedE/YeeE